MEDSDSVSQGVEFCGTQNRKVSVTRRVTCTIEREGGLRNTRRRGEIPGFRQSALPMSSGGRLQCTKQERFSECHGSWTRAKQYAPETGARLA